MAAISTHERTNLFLTSRLVFANDSLVRIFHESACGGPQGVGPEACLNGTSQGATSEEAGKDDHIFRARCARSVPRAGSQFRGRSK